MARRSPVKVGLALAVICALSYGQAKETTCRSGCRGAAHTFKYKEGTTYKYNFDSKIQVSLSSAEGQQSVTEVKATVLLTQQPQCNQVLKLQNVQVITNDGKKLTHLPDSDKPISINYHDGHLEDSICITPGDSQNSLNLKRAIASIFQANLKSGHETDVFGSCPTEVATHKEGNIFVVEKTRNLNRCAFRENVKQDFFATAFNPNSEIKSSPVLNGDYDAKLRIKNGILDQAVVREHYLYVPFSVGNNGAKASVETTLKYAGTAKDNSQVSGGHPRSVIFEDPHPVNSPQANVNSILSAVKEIAKTIDVTVGENTAKAFSNLIRILRVSKKDDLLAVYNQVRAGAGFADKAGAKRIFLDALLQAQNGDNIEVAVELLKNKELNQVEQNLVYLGLSAVRHATEGSLNSAVALLNLPNLPRSAYLGIGNLAGTYCRQHSCENVDAINKLTQKLVQKLGNGKATNKQEENEIIYVLKGLANFHHLNDNILAKLTAIAQDKKAPNRVRATALETFLADPCKDKLRDSAISILKDIQQDSEVRIRAFLAVARCPNNKVGNAIKNLLENEPSYQVGGFIVTYIRNLRSSANPDRELAKQYLAFINLPKRFPFDLRKYSANGEFSYTIDTLGIANSIESNVIYSQNSFLPRSTSLNLTAEVFGHSLNFLELETRQENLDRLIEHYIGPRGLLRSSSLQELWNTKGKQADQIIKELGERIQKTLRARRDVSKSEIDHINKQVQVKTNELNNDLDLDLSIRSFGSEILFFNINDDVKKYTPEAVIDKIIEGLNNGLDRLKHFDETLRSNLLLLDLELAYPTSSGFPLRLGVEGISNVQVKASGEIDVRKLLREESTLKLKLIPSVNIEISGRLTIDTLLAESGLKVVSTLHSSTGGDLTLHIQKSAIDVKFALPLEQQNLLTASHDIVFQTREWGGSEVSKPLKFTQNKDFSICLDQLKDFIGLTFCGEFAGPNLQGKDVPVLPFPLSGDAKVAVTIEREDLSLYHYREVLYDDAKKIGAETFLEVIGANGQQKAKIGIEAFLIPELFVRGSLNSPITNAIVEGRITNTPGEKSVSLRFVHDNNEYLGKLGVGIQGSPDKSLYRPIILYKTPQNSALQVPPYRVEGQVIVEHKGPVSTFTFDNVRLVIPDQKTININGKLGNEPETIFADVTVSDGGNSATFKGKLRVNPNLVKYNAEVRNSVNPDANIHLKGELSRSTDEIKNFFQVAHGGDFSNKQNIITLENSLKHRNKGPQDYLLETKNKLSYPLLGANFEFEFELKPNAVQYELDIQYTNVKLGSELEWEHNNKRDGTDFEIEFSIWGLSNRLNLKSKRQVNGEQSQIENLLEVNGKRLEVNGKVKHHVKPQDLDVGADLIVKLPNHNTPFHVVSGLKLNTNDLDVSHKVTSGNTVYVDLFLKATRAGNANGSIKVNLQGQLVVNGHVKANRGNGNGEIIIELPAAKRSSKIDSTFTIHDPTYNVVINIYPLFNQDKSKKITLSTHTSVTETSIDSKNFIDVFGSKLEGNVKGTQQGEVNNGKTNGEVEITLPNNIYLAAKLNRDIKNVNGVINANILASLEHRAIKNQSGNKLTFKGQARNTKPDDQIYDLDYQVTAEASNGRNINVDFGIKKGRQGETDNLELSTKIYGSEIKSPLETTIKGNCKNGVGSYDAKSSYAPLGTLVVNGKYDLAGTSKPLSGDINVDLTTTSNSLKHLTVKAGGSILKGDLVNIKGQAEVRADSAEGPIVQFVTNGELHTSENEARAKGSFKSGQLEPITISAGIKKSDSKKDQQVSGDLSVEYGAKKYKGDLTLIRLPPHEYKLDVKFATPLEHFKNNRLQVHTKRNEEKTHFQSEVTLTNDGKTWTTNSDILLSETTPAIDIQVKCPEGKLRQLLVKITKLNDRQLGGQLKIVNQKKNFLLEGSIDANVESVDDFHIKVNANAPSLNVDKYVIEAQNKPAKAGRRIQVTAKSGNKNVLTGSTSYTAREEHGKLIVEGSGSFKVHDQTQSANFKYIRQNLNQAKNGETGLEISFDAGLGKKAIDAEFKFTNKQFRILNSYCEEKKQCAHVEIDVKTSEDLNNFNQEIEVAIDLRKLGLSHEFGLKAVTTRKENILDHTVDVHFQSQENSKYQYSLYLHPNEAGVSLTTPRRIISLEANAHAPPTILKSGGRATGEIVLYTDKKNHPDKKSGLIAFFDLKKNALTGEARFTNPGLRRPLVISLQSKFQPGLVQSKDKPGSGAVDTIITADIFAEPNQKITATYKFKWSAPKTLDYEASETLDVKSQGLGIDIHWEEIFTASVNQNRGKYSAKLNYAGAKAKYDSTLLYEYSPQNFHALVKVLNIDLLKINSQLQLSKNQQIVDSEVSCYGHSPLVSHLEVKNLNTLKFTLAKKSKPNDKLLINSGFIPGQIADFRAEVVKNGAKQELGHATVKLDDANFLKSDYNIQSKNIEELLVKPIRAGVQEEGDELRKISDQLSKNTGEELQHLGEVARRAAPNLEPLRQYYTGELNKIREEILQDKTIKDISEFLYNVLAAISQVVGDTFANFSSLIENIVQSLQNTFGKVIEGIQKDLLPNIKELADKVLKLSLEIIDAATNVALTIGATAAEIAEKYKPELQQLAAVFGEASNDIVKAIINLAEAIKSVIIDQWREVYKEFSELPFVQQARDEYERFVKHGLPAPENFANAVKDILSTLKDIAPTQELKQFIQTVSDYLVKKIKKEQVDDDAALSHIAKLGIEGATSLYGLIFEASPSSSDLQNVKLPLPTNLWNRLPRLAAVRVSPLSYVLGEDIDVPVEFLLSLVNKPRNWIPPFPLYGLVAQGQHIFTFDGKHLTFPGKCNYVLAHDAVDGNFSVVGTYNNGFLTAISLTQDSDTITLKKHGQVTVNNAPSELPTRKPNIAAYRDNEKITLVSAYGVRVVCGPELLVCSVTASGFYHGKLRGLLGNGNNEPYDDFTLPSGKIVTSESEFGNSYKTTSGCGAVDTVSHHGHHANPACEKLFSWESSLRYCYPFVNTGNYKMACEHGLAAGVKDTEQAIATAYVAACNQHNIPIRVPSEFAKCTNGDKPFSVGDEFSVKTPGKAADIVVLVDTSKENEATYKEYVQPLIQQLTSELSNKGVNDLEFHIIAYGGENQWPSHITTNGGKTTFKGKAPSLKFVENPQDEHFLTGCPQLDGLIEIVRVLGHDLKLAFGLDLQALTYNEGLEYPFRANAIKTVIAVTARPCQVGRFYPLQLLRTILYRNKDINLNLITPVNRSGAKSEAKNIVGFNSQNVYALGQTKNKIKHFSDLSKELTYDDYCIDFTVHNDGNVFVADHIHLQPKNARKQFVQVTSHGIVEQLLNTEKGYDCECKFVTPYTAVNVCKVEFVKEKSHGKKAAAKS